jgi:hypothetical protein
VTITEQYSATASQATSTVEKIIDFWTQGARALSNPGIPGLPQVDMIPAVERYFEFVQRTVDLSRDFTIKWVEAGNTLTGVLREQAESASGLVREQAETTRDLVHEQASQAEKAARDQARQVREKARERYEGKSKAELSDLLDRRNLPKTGNVDELIERLVEADGK